MWTHAQMNAESSLAVNMSMRRLASERVEPIQLNEGRAYEEGGWKDRPVDWEAIRSFIMV